MTTVRPETSDDFYFARKVHLLAFGQPAEANLLNELRKRGKLVVSLIAETKSQVVSHIGFSFVTAVNAPWVLIAGLGPMAVLPEFQKKGIGSMLARQGIEECRNRGMQAIVVLGHPDYYPRFGFRTAGLFGLKSVYDAPEEAFMAMELDEGALSVCRGLMRYQPEFDIFE